MKSNAVARVTSIATGTAGASALACGVCCVIPLAFPAVMLTTRPAASSRPSQVCTDGRCTSRLHLRALVGAGLRGRAFGLAASRAPQACAHRVGNAGGWRRTRLAVRREGVGCSLKVVAAASPTSYRQRRELWQPFPAMPRSSGPATWRTVNGARVGVRLALGAAVPVVGTRMPVRADRSVPLGGDTHSPR